MLFLYLCYYLVLFLISLEEGQQPAGRNSLNCTWVCGTGSGCLLQAVGLRGGQRASLSSHGGKDAD